MEFKLLTCQHCSTAETFYTADELGNHRLAAHERPIDLEACAARLEAEAHIIGRARVGVWEADESHWVAERIAGRNGVAPETP